MALGPGGGAGLVVVNKMIDRQRGMVETYDSSRTWSAMLVVEVLKCRLRSAECGVQGVTGLPSPPADQHFSLFTLSTLSCFQDTR